MSAFERSQRRDPSQAELREAVMPYAVAIGCTCQPAIRWCRDGDSGRIEVEHWPWCRVGRDGSDDIAIVVGR
jgi:hypothetical protein